MDVAMRHGLRVVAEGLAFPEALRWHGDRLWFSDILAGEVLVLDPAAGSCVVVAHVPPMAGGLGWLPDGSLLVVACEQRQVLRVGPVAIGGALNVTMHADLSPWWEHPANDMHVDVDGTAFVGGYGFDPATQEPTSSQLMKIAIDGTVTPLTPDLVFPNGMARLPDGGLLVAETFADRLAVLRTTDAGAELIRRIGLPAGSTPDGICVGPDGAAWVAAAYGEAVLRVDLATGQVDRAVELPGQGVYDCTFGGEDRRTLLVATSDVDESRVLETRPGRILALDGLLP